MTVATIAQEFLEIAQYNEPSAGQLAHEALEIVHFGEPSNVQIAGITLEVVYRHLFADGGVGMLPPCIC